MTLIAIFLIGVLAGAALGQFFLHIRPSGTLRIDASDPTEPPYIFLELYKGTDELSERKRIELRVSTESYIPHK